MGIKLRTCIEAVKSHKGHITHPFQIANAFNKTFSEMGKTLATKIIVDSNETSIQIPNSMVLLPTNYLEIQDIIKDLKPKNTAGIDGIESRHI